MLQEKDRQKLDSIVAGMSANNESEENIKFVVNDFKSKYDIEGNVNKMFGYAGFPIKKPAEKPIDQVRDLRGINPSSLALIKAPKEAIENIPYIEATDFLPGIGKSITQTLTGMGRMGEGIIAGAFAPTVDLQANISNLFGANEKMPSQEESQNISDKYNFLEGTLNKPETKGQVSIKAATDIYTMLSGLKSFLPYKSLTKNGLAGVLKRYGVTEKDIIGKYSEYLKNFKNFDYGFSSGEYTSNKSIAGLLPIFKKMREAGIKIPEAAQTLGTAMGGTKSAAQTITELQKASQVPQNIVGNAKVADEITKLILGGKSAGIAKTIDGVFTTNPEKISKEVGMVVEDLTDDVVKNIINSKNPLKDFGKFIVEGKKFSDNIYQGFLNEMDVRGNLLDGNEVADRIADILAKDAKYGLLVEKVKNGMANGDIFINPDTGGLETGNDAYRRSLAIYNKYQAELELIRKTPHTFEGSSDLVKVSNEKYNANKLDASKKVSIENIFLKAQGDTLRAMIREQLDGVTNGVFSTFADKRAAYHSIEGKIMPRVNKSVTEKLVKQTMGEDVKNAIKGLNIFDLVRFKPVNLIGKIGLEALTHKKITPLDEALIKALKGFNEVPKKDIMSIMEISFKNLDKLRNDKEFSAFMEAIIRKYGNEYLPPVTTMIMPQFTDSTIQAMKEIHFTPKDIIDNEINYKIFIQELYRQPTMKLLLEKATPTQIGTVANPIITPYTMMEKQAPIIGNKGLENTPEGNLTPEAPKTPVNENKGVTDLIEEVKKRTVASIPSLKNKMGDGIVVPIKSLGREAYLPLLEEYKGHDIVKAGDDIAVWNKEKQTLFRVAEDDTKMTGTRFIDENINTVDTAKKYIDFITTPKKYDLSSIKITTAKTAQGKTFYFVKDNTGKIIANGETKEIAINKAKSQLTDIYNQAKKTNGSELINEASKRLSTNTKGKLLYRKAEMENYKLGGNTINGVEFAKFLKDDGWIIIPEQRGASVGYKAIKGSSSINVSGSVSGVWKEYLKIENDINQQLDSEAKGILPKKSASDAMAKAMERQQIIKNKLKEVFVKQDIGEKFGGAKKDLAILRSKIFTGELTDAEAYKNVTKDKVLSKKEWENTELDYIKKELFASVPTRPEDSPKARDFFLNEFPIWSDKIIEAKSIDEIKQINEDFFNSFKNKGLRVRLNFSSKLSNVLTGRTSDYRDWFYKKRIEFGKLKEMGEGNKLPVTKRETFRREELKEIIREGGKDIGNIEAEYLIEQLGHRGVEYGNWIKTGEAKSSIVNYANAMTDLGDIVGIDIPKFNKKMNLGIAFGSRGSGWASAHYEPANKVINLTKTRGDGAVAHEWGHALDNLLAEQVGGKPEYATKGDAKDPEIKKVFKDIIEKIKEGAELQTVKRGEGMGKPSYNSYDRYVVGNKLFVENNPMQTYNNSLKSLGDKGSAKNLQQYILEKFDLQEFNFPDKLSGLFDKSLAKSKYWSSDVELFARVFENYVKDKGLIKGIKNNYLVKVPDNDMWRLTEKEKANMYKEYDKLFKLLSK